MLPQGQEGIGGGGRVAATNWSDALLESRVSGGGEKGVSRGGGESGRRKEKGRESSH